MIDFRSLIDFYACRPGMSRVFATYAAPMPTEAIDLYDPDGYVDGPPHETFERLRARAARLLAADARRHRATGRCCATPTSSPSPASPKTFSASRGGVVLEDLAPETLAMMQDMLLAMDPPRHVGYRRNVAPQFVPRVIDQLEPRIRAICREIMRDAADAR